MLRKDEAQKVHKMLTEDLGVNLTVVDASDLFLSRLKGVEDPEKKRKIIGNTFIEVFEDEALKLEAAAEKEMIEHGGEGKGKIEWLLQGTLYPDVIESISFKGPSATIKTHHNVGGLLEDMKLKLIEPLRELFKGESSLLDCSGIRAARYGGEAFIDACPRRSPSSGSIARHSCASRRTTPLPWSRSCRSHPGRGEPRTDHDSAARRRHLHRGDQGRWTIRSDQPSICGALAGQGCGSCRRR